MDSKRMEIDFCSIVAHSKMPSVVEQYMLRFLPLFDLGSLSLSSHSAQRSVVRFLSAAKVIACSVRNTQDLFGVHLLVKYTRVLQQLNCDFRGFENSLVAHLAVLISRVVRSNARTFESCEGMNAGAVLCALASCPKLRRFSLSRCQYMDPGLYFYAKISNVSRTYQRQLF
jgi:hypothetical protein